MSVSLYKAREDMTGMAFSFSRGLDQKTKEPRLYIEALKQASWNSKTKNGSFKESKDDPSKNIRSKFNLFEAGEIIRVLQNGGEWSSFHAFENDKTSIKVCTKPRKVKTSTKNKKTGKYEDKWIEVPAYTFSMVRNGSLSFGIGITQGEAEVICEYLKMIITDALKVRDEETQKRLKDSQKNQGEDAPF